MKWGVWTMLEREDSNEEFSESVRAMVDVDINIVNCDRCRGLGFIECCGWKMECPRCRGLGVLVTRGD